MKRSEALDIIEDYLMSFDSTFDGTRETAENILKDLEKAGMLPPTTTLSHIHKKDNYWESEE